MAYLNANIPIIDCYVRKTIYMILKNIKDKYFEVGIFGFSSIPNQGPIISFINGNGGLWWRAPISVFVKRS